MHIPDGFLDAKTWVSATAISTGSWATALLKPGNKSVTDRYPNWE
ncbi:hypothetical protein [Desulforamulus profundi]